jgi:sugar lactone lactonase YvrE
MMDRRIYRIEAGGLALHADLSDMAPFALNDMVVGADGRAYVGSSEFDPFEPAAREPAATGALILVRPDGTTAIAAEGLAFPNGMAITQHGRLLVCESFASRLSSYAIGADGGLGDRQVEVETPGGAPDGCCLDRDGGVWVALHRAERFVRVKAGLITETIHTPGRKAIACQLGHDDGCTLFCLTLGGEIAAIETERTAQVEAVRVSVPAAGSP